MSEPKYTGPDQRAPQPPKVSTTTGYSLGAGLMIATIHWLIKAYHPGSGWDFHAPDDGLIEMWVFAVLPAVHLIARIIMNHLQRLAGPEEVQP